MYRHLWLMRHTNNQNLGRFGPSGRLLELFEIMVTDSRAGRRATCSSGSGSRGSLVVGLDVSLLIRFRVRVAVVGGGGGLRTVLLAVRVVERHLAISAMLEG